MALHNPVSRTHLKVTADRLQHYSNDLFRCDECGHEYHPKVYSQPYVVQFGAILVGLAIFAVFKVQAPPWLYVVAPIVILGLVYGYSRRDRHVVAGGSPVRYGDYITECPRCGNSSATRVAT